MSDANLARVDGEALTRLDDLIWIGDIPRRGAEACPDRDAVVFTDRGVRLTYRTLDCQGDAFAALLAARGLGTGDRIGYLGRNSDLFFPVLFGAIRAGVVVVPINWRLAAPEVAFQLEDSGARLLISDPELSATVAGALRLLERPPAVMLTEAPHAGDDLRRALSADAVAAPLPHIPDQVILHLYTSGTTGRPKGVLISHEALSMARHMELASPRFAMLTTGSVTLSAMPNFHVGGMSWVLMGLIRRGTVVLTADPTPANLLALMTEHRVEQTFMVATVIRAIVDDIRARQLPPPPLAAILYGAMPIGEALLRETMDVLRCSFGQVFGMTEISGAATFLEPQDHDLARPHLLRSVGRPYPGMEIEIRGPDRRVLACEEHGEIWIRSPTRMLGYWRLPEVTAQALVDGWYATGDGGHLDAEGYLYLTDRIKDMIVSGGENVYPAEVEEMLRSHPAVLDAACVGMAHAVWGECVVAIIESRPGIPATEESLREFARARIAHYKCPKRYVFTGALPRTASGKVRRAELRAALGPAGDITPP